MRKTAILILCPVFAAQTPDFAVSPLQRRETGSERGNSISADTGINENPPQAYQNIIYCRHGKPDLRNGWRENALSRLQVSGRYVTRDL